MGELVGDLDAFEVRLANVFGEVKHHLDERARRLLGAMAREIGHGGISLVAEVTATATDTVGRGAAELAAGIEPDGRIRRKGAGRKPVTETDPAILAALDELVDAESRFARYPASAQLWKGRRATLLVAAAKCANINSDIPR